MPDKVSPGSNDLDDEEEEELKSEMTFVEHLVEMRDRMLQVLIVVVVFLLIQMPFANEIYGILAAPLIESMPEGTSMIATEVASPFLAPFKLVLVLSIFLAMPMVLYHFWGFVAPGLYRKERKLTLPLMVTSVALFYLGMAFAYYVVFPLMFAFFQAWTPEGVVIMTDISAYLNFVLKIFFAFGIAFEVPIATILVVWSGFTTADALAEKRPYVIVGAFVLGMLLTPPDLISQTLLAVPMWILFELGVFFSRVYFSGDGEQEPAEESSAD